MELIIYEDHQNGNQRVLGSMSVTLSGSMGFTDAIAYHFYEKGYEPHSHVVEKTYEVKSYDDAQSMQGDISVYLKLTCHGPETNQVNRVVLATNLPRLRPIFIDVDGFDYKFDKQIIELPPKMTYEDVDERDNPIITNNPEIKVLLRCQRYYFLILYLFLL